MRRLKKIHLDKIIGQNIMDTRNAHDLTRDELAEMMELTSSHLGLIERGERGATAVTLASLSKILNIPIDHLFMKHQTTSQKPKNSESRAAQKRLKITSLLTCLSESELNFLVYVIRGIPRELKNNA